MREEQERGEQLTDAFRAIEFTSIPEEQTKSATNHP